MYVCARRGQDFDSYSAGAAWADTKLLASSGKGWKKVAIVSDADWLRVASQIEVATPFHQRAAASSAYFRRDFCTTNATTRRTARPAKIRV
jgi:hypothetical protein